MDASYPSTTLLLIRHAQARSIDGSYGDETPLSALGRRQAAALAAALVAHPPTALYTSPLARAAETAALLGAKLGLTPLVDDRLTEFTIPPTPLDQIALRPDLAFWHHEHRGGPGGESLGEFSARVATCCDDLVLRHPGARIALVSHAGTIDAALRWALNIPPTSPWTHEFDLSNASVSEVEFWPRGRTHHGAPRYAYLRRVGDSAYLGEDLSDI